MELIDQVKKWVTQNFIRKRDLALRAGSWTPAISCSGVAFTSITYDATVRYGTYTCIGKLCFYSLYVNVDAFTLGAGTGYLKISLPFTARSGERYTVRAPASMSGVNVNSIGVVFGSIPGQAYGAFTELNDDGAWTNIPISGLAAGDTFLCSGWYWTD